MLSNRHREWTSFLETILVLKQRSESQVLSIPRSDWGSTRRVSLLSHCLQCMLPLFQNRGMKLTVTFMQDLSYWTIFVSFYLSMHWKPKASVESQGEKTAMFLLLLPSDTCWSTHHVSVDLFILDISYKWNQIASCVAYFIKHYTFKVHLCCSIYQRIITFIGE